ncbi:MAG: hypothetical protein JWO42_1047 [Chloroflexi bacterium]|nr:hypothetical protein [Chloroflexota bacterium]
MNDGSSLITIAVVEPGRGSGGDGLQLGRRTSLKHIVLSATMKYHYHLGASFQWNVPRA